MYALLSGYLPFDDQDEQEVIRKTVKSPVSFTPPKFAEVSENAKKFVAQLLEKDKHKRISIEEVVEHPWANNTPDDFFVHSTSNTRSFNKQITLETAAKF